MRIHGFKPEKGVYLYLHPNYSTVQKISSLLVLLMLSLGLQAQTCTIAVAANAYDVVQELAGRFQAVRHLSIKLVSGASGTLTAQIRNGAPYSLFLSADTSFPHQLYKEGLTLGRPVVYAKGKLVLCSTLLKDIHSWQLYLGQHPGAKIALATPAGAPYGKAAEEFLRYYRLTDKVKPQLVYGTSISQVNTYILTGAVIMGFSSQSFIELCRRRNQPVYAMDAQPGTYAPVLQGMVLLKQGSPDERQIAEKFYTFLQSTEATALFKEYGYSK